MADRQPSHDGLGVEAFALHAGGFLAVELVGDLALVLLGEQLALLLFEVGQKGVAAAKLFLAGGGLFGEVPLDEGRQALTGAGAERDGLIVVLDGGFDLLGAVVAVGALAALVEATDEVLVGAAVAFVARVEQAVAAVLAKGCALEVVLVLAVALAAQGVRLQDRLGAVE